MPGGVNGVQGTGTVRGLKPSPIRNGASEDSKDMIN